MFKAVLNFIKDDINNEQRLDYLVKNRLLLIFRYEMKKQSQVLRNRRELIQNGIVIMRILIGFIVIDKIGQAVFFIEMQYKQKE